MRGGIGEDVVNAEKKGAVGGYILNLVEWGKNKRRKSNDRGETPSSTEVVAGRPSDEKRTVEDSANSGTTSAQHNNSQNGSTAIPKSDIGPLSNDAVTDQSPPKQLSNGKSKGKSSLPKSFLRRPSISSGSESESESDTSTSSFDYGPPEFEPASNKEEEPIIPDPGVFTSTRLAQTPVTQMIMMEGLIPTVAQCAAHLELLGCFSKLRADVETSDAIGKWLFGSKQLETQNSDDNESVADKDIKWRAFVSKAVERFYTWWLNFPKVVSHIDAQTDNASSTKKGAARGDERRSFIHWNKKKVQEEDVSGLDLLSSLNEFQRNDFASGVKFRSMTKDTLPPLDVLLVWHAYTLNPHSFYEDCIRLNRLELWGMPLPWDLIHEAINNYDFTYTLPANTATFFTRITGQPADLYHSLIASDQSGEPQKQALHCPWCEKTFSVNLAELHKYGDVADYKGVCGNCGKEYDKDTTAVSIFLKDVHQFFVSESRRKKADGDKIWSHEGHKSPNYMFRGGVLHPGTGHYKQQPHPSTNDRSYPSRALLSGVLLSAFPQLHPTTDKKDSPDFPSLLAQFGSTPKLQSHLQNYTQLATTPDEPNSPIPILRRILTNINSTYKYLPLQLSISPALSSSPSIPIPPLSIDLSAAVLRQGVFIRKIHNDALLIRSPALAGTISRSRVRYAKFFRLIGKYKGTIFVPTNEIDLVWHTQQCFPLGYYTWSNLVTGLAGGSSGSGETTSDIATTQWKYIDHNDRLGEGTLGNGFEDTKRLWKVEYANANVNPMQVPSSVEKVSRGLAGLFHGTRKKGRRTSSAEGSGIVNGDTSRDDDAEGKLPKDTGTTTTVTTPEDEPEWEDPDGKYAICVCWNCELRKEIETELSLEGKRKERKWLRSRSAEGKGFTKKDEWGLRATVFYYRKVEEARRAGERLPVWKDREPWL